MGAGPPQEQPGGEDRSADHAFYYAAQFCNDDMSIGGHFLRGFRTPTAPTPSSVEVGDVRSFGTGFRVENSMVRRAPVSRTRLCTTAQGPWPRGALAGPAVYWRCCGRASAEWAGILCTPYRAAAGFGRPPPAETVGVGENSARMWTLTARRLRRSGASGAAACGETGSWGSRAGLAKIWPTSAKIGPILAGVNQLRPRVGQSSAPARSINLWRRPTLRVGGLG